jgi:hypothetical protein
LIVGVHIVKATTWRGATEEFENVYHYDTPAINTSAGWEDLVNSIVTAEKTFHSTNVNFLRARIHGPTNTTQGDDVMRHVQDLSGAGGGSVATNMPREMTIVCQLYMGRTERGYKAFLRKYWHTEHAPNSGAGATAGNTALAAADKTYFAGKLDGLKSLNIGPGACHLCKPNGDHVPAGTGAQCLDYAHIRQFRR